MPMHTNSNVCNREISFFIMCCFLFCLFVVSLVENSHCSAHLINDGVTVNVTEVTVEWQGTGPSVAGNATVRADIFECQFPDISPTQFSCEQMCVCVCVCVYVMH